ncbi:MFS transporter [Protofrankia symbiont of Coriaria ruscifolia]|uniref:Major facilitator superfamily protein n=1 Tax=Candidatus Protofrankia californiensis TaxID=1839754 RepID=A0A1C3NYB5_9ACTN|nr:MFS transporter [Protofrankia symbiont of Coriaria ruscifolia]SBW22569.1 major facilitator superfamily protein [Candidatus Protofrankia californiensis]
MNTVPMFRLFLVSRAVSWVGTAMTLVALPVLLYQRTGSAAAAGVLAGLEAVPYLVLGLPAGALVDRWDQRRTLMLTSFSSGLVMASIPLASWAGILTTPHLFIAAVGVSSIFVFFDAAGFGALPAIVGRDAVPGATGAMVSVSTLVNLVGPAVGGVATTTLGAAGVLALDALSYVLAAVLLARVRWTVEPATGSADDETTDDGTATGRRRVTRTRRDIAEGLRYIWDHRVIRTLTLLGTGASISGGAVSGLLVVVAVEQFGLADDDSRIGLLYAAAAFGTLITSTFLSRIQQRAPTGLITLCALGVSWLALIWWSRNTVWLLGLGILILWQASNSLVILNGIVVRQAVTPQRLQGRVNTTARMIAWGGTPLGAMLAGALAEAWDIRTALLVTSSGVGVALAIGAGTNLRRTGKLADLIGAREMPAPGAPAERNDQPLTGAHTAVAPE